MTVALDDAELGLLKEAAALPDAAERGLELLGAEDVRAVNPALAGEFAGALFCRRDAIVEPRLVPQAFRDYLNMSQARSGPAIRGCPAGRR